MVWDLGLSTTAPNILFIIHNMFTWSAIALIYKECKQRNNVNVFVLAISENNKNELNLQNSYSYQTSEKLKKLGIAHHVISDN